jgi:hypothetical protein
MSYPRLCVARPIGAIECCALEMQENMTESGAARETAVELMTDRMVPVTPEPETSFLAGT